MNAEDPNHPRVSAAVYDGTPPGLKNRSASLGNRYVMVAQTGAVGC